MKKVLWIFGIVTVNVCWAQSITCPTSYISAQSHGWTLGGNYKHQGVISSASNVKVMISPFPINTETGVICTYSPDNHALTATAILVEPVRPFGANWKISTNSTICNGNIANCKFTIAHHQR